MPSIDDKNETEEDDMDQDSSENEKSEEEDSDTCLGTDEDDSSDMDDGEYDKRRSECLCDMAELERQFSDLKEQLYTERSIQIKYKLEEVKAGKANEYLSPLAQLQENMRIRTQVSGIWRDLELQNIRNKFEAEEQASRQHYESEKLLLYDQVKQDLEEKIRRLEEDRHNTDISSDLWNESQQSMKKSRRKNSTTTPERRRKPVTVSGPYIVYMLKEMDIIEDWTAIKKALKQTQRKKEEKYPFSARYEDGKLYYQGDCYTKGMHIIIDNRTDSPVHASITAINTGEVWVKRADGNKSKLFIAQLQKGKYTIRQVPY